MNEKNDFALVPRPPSTIEKSKPGPKRILSSMVTETLALASAAAEFRIGDYEWCEPDYLQLLAWSEQLKLDPIEVVRRLKDGLRRKCDETRIEAGKFTKLNWDAGLLPISDFRISFPLELTDLTFAPISTIDESSPNEELEGFGGDVEFPEGYSFSARILQISTVTLPKLRRLNCAEVGLEVLTMSTSPRLQYLNCSANDLSALELSSFPALKELKCFGNCFDCLDLTPVPELLELDCQDSQIKELRLSLAAKIRKLDCSNNFMKKLILPYLPDLVELICFNNYYDKSSGLAGYFTQIELDQIPNLEIFDCSYNAIETLDLSRFPRLRQLDCSHNPLTKLDLKPVPMLESLDCSWSHLRELDLSSVPELRKLWCDSTRLTEIDLNRVPGLEFLSCSNQNYDSIWIKTLDIRPLPRLAELGWFKKTQLVKRPDQDFAPDES